MTTDIQIRRQASTNAPGGQSEEPQYRLLPHNLEAEQGLLGALLINNRALEKVGDFLRPDHFFVPAHQRIYVAILKLIDRGQTAAQLP